MNHHYNSNLRERAHELHTTSRSIAEKHIWKALLSRNRMGVKFKRQRPVSHFVVDFFSAEIGLIIEVDGSSHLTTGNYDRYRQNRLEQMGYTVVRFSDGEVMHQLDDVKRTIAHAIHCLKES